MPALPLVEAVLASIFGKIEPLCKRQRIVLTELFRLILLRQGRVNFTNLARYSKLHEHTLRRHFTRPFDWLAFNLAAMRLRAHPRERLIGVFDATFLPKSGTKTWGLDRFFSSAAGSARQGLEVSLVGVVGVESRRAFGLGAAQTPPNLAMAESGAADGGAADGGATRRRTRRRTRMDFYLAQVVGCLPHLPQVRYWVGDGGYARRKFFGALAQAERHFITRLRSDANLRYLYVGPRKTGPGAPRRYDGKVDFADLSRFDEIGSLEGASHVLLYHSLAWSVHFGCTLGVVVLVHQRTGGYVVLCTTDPEQAPEEVVAFYRLRYQIEFVIRDAKQHTGLSQGQARDRQKQAFHLNLSVAAVGVLRLVGEKLGVSLTSVRREGYNAFLVERCLGQLGLGAEFSVLSPRLLPVLLLGSLRRQPRAAPA